jgi:hypothetical protein
VRAALPIVVPEVLLAGEDGLGDESEALTTSILLKRPGLEGDDIWLSVLSRRQSAGCLKRGQIVKMTEVSGGKTRHEEDGMPYTFELAAFSSL